MKVLVTGATGFTGSYVLPLLLAEGFEPRCFIRATSNIDFLPPDVEVATGDLSDPDSLTRALEGMDTLVNLASMGFGHAPNIVSAANRAGISRAIFISTTAIFTTLNALSKTVREAAEKTVRESGLAYTIIRPTMIYGSSRDRNICRLIRYLNSWPAIPIFGDGNRLMQPVFVEDLARVVLAALETQSTIGRAYDVSGAAPLTFNKVIDTILGLLGRRVLKIHFPASPVVASLKFLERFVPALPIKAEQIQRLNEDKAFDHTEAARDMNYRPRTFEAGVRRELDQLGLL